MTRKTSLSSRALIIALSLLLSSWSFAQPPSSSRHVEEEPTALAMTADALLVRPVMLGVTIIGSALWLVSLPFSAAGGNIKEAGQTLVIGPAKTTFVRCLGCTNPGYKHDIPDGEK
jgi:hypothetical protein